MVQALIVFVIAFVLVPLVAANCFYVGALDRPNERRVHRGSIPNWGGVAIGLSTITILPPGAIIVCVAGAIDGIRSISARSKIPIQLFAAWWAVCDMPDMWLALAWVVLVTNAMNLIDGVDGLASGTAITLLSCVLLLLPTPSPFVWPLIGALMAFWWWNRHPASVFLGDSGSYLIGFCLGYATLSLPWTVKLALFAYPLADVAWAFLRRGIHWARPDKRHLHHLLLQSYSQPQAVAWLYGVVLVSTWLALFIA